VVVKVEVKV